MRKTTLRITKAKVKRGGTTQKYWCVVVPKLGGGRTRKFYPYDDDGKKAAETFLSISKTQQENYGTAALTLTPAERAEYMDARATLAPYGVTVREAIAMLMPQLKAANRSRTVKELSAELLKAKKADGASNRYQSDLKSRMKKFTAAFETRTVASITSADIDGWLRSLDVAPVTRNNFRRVLNVAFNFAKLQGYCVANPAENTAEAKDVDKPAAILAPTQASALLEKCTDDLVPYVSVALFAGLRAAELEKLDWNEIDLTGGFVEVTAQKSKTARRRLVPISDNLRAWLQPMAKKAGPVAPIGLRKRLEAVRAAAGFETWESNAMRHSYGSYRLAQCHDAAKVSLEMGNSPAMVFSHYRELVKPKDADQYWSIRPAVEANNVVAMTA